MTWLVLQLADAAFPAGGFAHSSGLEPATQHGFVEGRGSFARFLDDALFAAGTGALPFALAAHRSPSRMQALDHMLDATLVNHVTNRASRTQGRAFLDTCARIFPGVAALQIALRPLALHLHHAPIFGRTLAALGISEQETARLFLHLTLRSVASAAVRLGLVGPYEAQRLQHQAAPTLERVLTTCSALDVEDAAQTSPIVDLLQGTHDRLYSRLFQS